MSDKRVRKFLQAGTLECMILWMVIGLIIGIGFLCIGFWSTLLLTCLILLGLFIGGVANKREFLSDWYNRIFPARAQQAVAREKLAQQVRETVNNDSFEEEDEGEGKEAPEEQSVEEMAQDAVSALDDKAEEAAEEIREEAQEIRQEAGDAAQDALDALQEQAQGAVDALKAGVENAADAVKEKLEKAKDQVEETVQNAQDTAQAVQEDITADVLKED